MQRPKSLPGSVGSTKPPGSGAARSGGWTCEWQKIPAKRKQPPLIVVKDDRLFGFGSLWERWSGEVSRSYTMTAEPNVLPASMHIRMVPILTGRITRYG